MLKSSIIPYAQRVLDHLARLHSCAIKTDQTIIADWAFAAQEHLIKLSASVPLPPLLTPLIPSARPDPPKKG